MVQVTTAPHNPEAHLCNGTEDCATPTLSAYPAANVVTAVTTTFSDREPAIAEFLSNMSFTNAQMGEVLAWQEDNNASNEEAAVYFLTSYSDVWSGWISEDAKGNLSALLK